MFSSPLFGVQLSYESTVKFSIEGSPRLSLALLPTATFKVEAQVLQGLKQTLRKKLVFNGCSPPRMPNFMSLGTSWISYLDARSAKCLKDAFKHFMQHFSCFSGWNIRESIPP